jgi:hypothetical protein
MLRALLAVQLPYPFASGDPNKVALVAEVATSLGGCEPISPSPSAQNPFTEIREYSGPGTSLRKEL